MIFYVVLCVILESSLGFDDRTTHKMAAATDEPRINESVYRKTAELIYLINQIYNNYKSKSQENLLNTHNDRESSLTQIMELIQKNYDASKLNKEKSKVRVHFISNPEVLEQFKNVLKDRKSSLFENTNVGSRQLKEILRSLRRQAVFRIDDPESDEKRVLEEQGNLEANERSAEDKQTDKLIKESANGIYSSRKKETENKENADNNAWDIITKKYDWDKDNWDQKDWGVKGGNISDEKKKRKIDKWNDWGKDEKVAYDDGRDIKENVKRDDWDLKDKNKGLKKKNVDELDEWGQKDRDKWEDWGQKKETLKGDKPKEKVEIKREQPKNKRKGSDTKEKESEWDNWEATTRQKRKITKKKGQSYKKINEWEHYIPKIQNKPKRYKFERNVPAGALGRTSIPFVGKKGIYEDK